MSRIDNLPENTNYLGDLSFQFSIKKLPNVNFFLQKVTIPDLYVQPVAVSTPFADVNLSGDHMQYSPLSVTFIVDEDMKNYLELHNWLRGLSWPTEYKEYKDLWYKGEIGVGEGVLSDASLLVGNNLKNMNLEFLFVDAFPFSLSGLEFSTTENDMRYLTATAQFKYMYYDFQYLKSPSREMQ
jgi:hypothetical protein